MISSAVAALNLGSAPHARAAADENGTAAGEADGCDAAADDETAAGGADGTGEGGADGGGADGGGAAVASKDRAVLGTVRAGAFDDAWPTAAGELPAGPASVGSAATAQQTAIAAASASRLPGIGRLSAWT
jgi:hypothetical protein